MAYKVIILYRLYMPSYFLGTFTEYPFLKARRREYQSIRPASRLPLFSIQMSGNQSFFLFA